MGSIVEGELTSIATCWRLERLDGAGIGLTSHDQPIVSENITYEAKPGMAPASVTRALGFEPHSAEIAGALSTDALTESDLTLGRWDGAQMRLAAVDWARPDVPPIPLIAGEIGAVSLDGDGFTADLRGAAARLDDPVCPATSAECRARFGDKQCRVDLSGRTTSAHVVSAEDGELTLDRGVDDRFVLGRLRYMGGANCGLTNVILSASGSTLRLRDLMRAPVEAGCRVELREGCDKRFQTCVQRFQNAVNFRGEPFLPGNDLLIRYPGV